LVNGGSIRQIPMREVTYWHVELAQHSIVLAEGLPAESYLDVNDRSLFNGTAGPVVLHPDFTALTWDAVGCAPLVVTGPELDAARALIRGADLAAREVL
jgi:serralysin